MGSTTGNSSDGSTPCAEGKDVNANWKSLFNFTTRKHTMTLTLGMAFALPASVVMPIFTVILGDEFEMLADLTFGKVSPDGFIRSVKQRCTELVVLGGVSWILNSAYTALFTAFGEQQATSARDTLFLQLMKRDLEWFDVQKDGTAPFLAAAQRYVFFFFHTST